MIPRVRRAGAIAMIVLGLVWTAGVLCVLASEILQDKPEPNRTSTGAGYAVLMLALFAGLGVLPMWWGGRYFTHGGDPAFDVLPPK